MSKAVAHPLVAVDIGNSRLKFGLFEGRGGASLPEPVRTLRVWNNDGDLDVLCDWLGRSPSDAHWILASVNRPAASRLVDWLRERGAEQRTRMLASFDLPLEIAVPRPDMVGIDRLAGAMAANLLRPTAQAAVVVDLGTAITVDVVNEQGVFLGGAILPGIGMSARAMHEFTDLLPLLDMEALVEPPPAIGTATVEAMTSGLYWGAIGAAKELIAQFGRSLASEPQIFLTGGAAASVAQLITPGATFVPNLVLGGIAVAGAKLIAAEAAAGG